MLHSLGILALILFTLIITSNNNRFHNSVDQEQYISIGYNLARFGTFSLEEKSSDSTETPEIYGAREPLYPFLLSLVFRAAGYDLAKIKLSDLIRNGDHAYPNVIATLKILQQILFTAVVVATLIAIVCFTGSWPLAYVMAFLLAGSDALWVQFLRVETLSALLSIVLALALWAGMVAENRTPRLLAWVGAGVVLGLLSLTKGVYQFLPPLILVGCLILLAWTYLRRRRLETRILDGIVIALVAYAFILPWSARNYVQLNKFTISTRSASILEARAAFSDITFDEYLASVEFFSEFSGIGYTPVDHPFASRDDMRRLIDRYSDHRKIDYPTFRNRENIADEMAALRDAGHSRSAAAAIIYLKSLPVQIAMVLPLSVRASNLYVREWYPPTKALQIWAQISLDMFRTLRWAFIPIFLGGVVAAAYRQDWPVFVAFLPSLYHYGMYGAFTHYIPRYNAMLVPVFLVAFSYVLVLAWRWVRARRANAKLQSKIAATSGAAR